MRPRKDQRGFVLSGIALLLVLPAMLLAASLLRIAETGGEVASLQALSDKVSYTGHDIERVIKNMWEENRLSGINVNAKFLELVENYRAATGLLIDLTPTWMFWIKVVDTGEIHRAGTVYSWVGEASEENWYYRFEELNEGLWLPNEPDYDEPVLLVEKLDENLRITIVDYDGIFHADVYYSDQLLWELVGGLKKNHVGENTIVDNTVQLRVFVHVRDARGTARFSSTVELG